MTYRAATSHPASGRPDRPVRLVGGIFSLLVLSLVAMVMATLDHRDRSRIERSIVQPRRGTEPKPWTATMSARTIDAPKLTEAVTSHDLVSRRAS